MATVLPPDTRLKRRFKGSARAMILPGQIEAAQARMDHAALEVTKFVMLSLADSTNLARQRPFNAPRQLYEHAHAIRGIAGMCGLSKLGEAAEPMCRLLDGVKDGARVDANLVTSIAVAMIHAARQPHRDPALLDELIAACHAAVEESRA